MDPIAHTLVGATLAETGLKKLSRYASPTLIIGANLPDIDGIANLWGRDAALYFRRGWSHGILALLVLPLLLAASIWLWHHYHGREAPGLETPGPETPGPETQSPQPVRMGIIVLLSFVAVWSHPLLDWMNTYGVRLLMPFDNRWFYGDTLFIIDPWFWLLAAAGIVVARSHTYGAVAGWALLGLIMTGLVISTDLVSVAVKAGWFIGVGAIIALRWRWQSPGFGELVARSGLVLLIVYIGILYGAARLTESIVAARAPAPSDVQANPVPGEPFSHRFILAYDSHYHIISADGELRQIARVPPNAIVRAALHADSIRGFVNWMRYPYWEVTETGSSWIVSFWDLRYLNPGDKPMGIGFAQVELSKEPQAPPGP